MKIKLRLFTAIIFVCVAAVLLLISCTSETDKADADKNDNPQSPENDDGYDYGDLDCKGEEFVFLNMTMDDWGFYTDIVRDSMAGEVLDDAIYDRNLAIEERYKVKLKALSETVNDAPAKFQTAVMAGDETYDAAFLQTSAIGGLISENLLVNLNYVPELKINQEWWNQSVMKDSALGYSKSLYFLFSDISIAALQCSWCIFMNEDMMINLGLELPYSFVKEGAWTYDKMYEYMKAGAQLNGGADNFRFEKEGPAIYGFTSFGSGITALLTASGERGAELDADGMPFISYDSDRFYSVVAKLAEILEGKKRGEYITANMAAPFHFEAIFGDSRALLMGGEMKAADRFRNMDDTYGILPMPKYDGNQSRYYSPITYYASPILVFPTTNRDLERAGTILDAMAYLSTRDLRPIFFETVMAQKRLRNDESIDMLYIIRDSMIYDIGSVYNWTTNITGAIVTQLDNSRTPNLASILEKELPLSRANMEKIMDLID